MVELGYDPITLEEFPAATKKSTKKPTEHQWKSKKRKYNVESEENDALKNVAEVMDTASRPTSNVQDADDLFGQYISSQLKSIKNQFLKKAAKYNFIWSQLSTVPGSNVYIDNGNIPSLDTAN